MMKNQVHFPASCSHAEGPDRAADLQKLLDASPDVFCTFDKDGHFVYASAAAKRVWGYEPHELIGRKYIDFVAPQDKESSLAAAAALIAGNEHPFFENSYIHRNGFAVPVLWSSRWDPQEQTAYCLAKNATERMEAERNKQINQQRIARAYTLSKTGWWEWDVKNNISINSDELYRIYGLSREEAPSITADIFLSLVHPEDRSAVYEHLRRLKKQSTHEYEHRLIKPTGETIYLLQSTESQWNSQGELQWVYGTTRDITETKKIQLQLEKSEKALDTMLQRIQEGFFALDRNWVVTYWNRQVELIMGRTAAAMIGKNVWDEFPQAIGKKFYNECLNAMEQQQPATFENYYADRDLWYECNLYPSPAGLSVFFRNISRRKQKEAEQKASEERIAEQNEMMIEVLEQMQEGFVTLTLSGKVIYWNSAAERIKGITREQALGANIRELLQPSLMDTPFYKVYKQLLNSKGPVTETVFSPHTQKSLELHAYRTQKGISVFFRDITEQKKAEEEVKKLSLVAKVTVNGVALLEPDRKISWVNEAFTKITGFTYEEAVGKRNSELLAGPETSVQTIKHLQDCFHHGKHFRGEILVYTKQKETKWLEVLGQPIFDGEGRFERYLVMYTDVSDRKNAQDELNKLSLIAEQTVNSVVISDRERKIVWINNACAQQSGYTLEEVVGKPVGELFDGPENDLEIMLHAQQWQEKKQPYHVEVLNYTKQGEPYWSDVSCQPLLDEQGEVQFYFSIATNITERKKLEEELELQRKKTTAAVIAAQEKERTLVGRELHDNVNQVLTSVKLYQELILSGVGNQMELVNKSKRLLQESINEIRSLSKRLSAPTLGNIKVKDSIQELLETVGATNKFKVVLDVSAVEELEISDNLHLGVYRILQEQLTNILKYAEATVVQVLVDFVDGDLMLKVTDNGKGFDIKQKRNGIGITNMTMRAESLCGNLTINSAPGLGCVLIARFPLL